MSLGNTSLALDLLNGATTWLADLDGSSPNGQALVVGSVYTFQAIGADIWLGFGATLTAAETDGASGTGEKLLADAPPRVIEIQTQAVQFVGCNGGTLRIRLAAKP